MSVEKGLSAIGNAAKNVAIGLGILILTAFVAVYGMNTFLNEPQYEDYCEDFSRSAVDVGVEPDVKDEGCYEEYDVASE